MSRGRVRTRHLISFYPAIRRIKWRYYSVRPTGKLTVTCLKLNWGSWCKLSPVPEPGDLTGYCNERQNGLGKQGFLVLGGRSIDHTITQWPTVASHLF